MVYSVRELVGLTFLSALILVDNVILRLFVLAGSCSALMIVILTFLGVLHQKIRAPEKRFADFRVFGLPILIPWGWGAVLYTSALLDSSNSGRIILLGKTMFLGVASASIPLLLTLETRHSELEDRLLYASAMALITGLVLSAASCVVCINFIADDASAILRVSSLCGMIGSVAVSWPFFAREPEKDSEQWCEDEVAEP